MEVLLPIVGIIFVLGIAAAIVASRYKIAKTTEAIIVTGRSKKDRVVTTTGTDGSSKSVSTTDLSGQRVVIGGGIFVLPFVQQHEKISLKSQSIEVKISSVPSADGILLNVEGVAIIKIGGTQEAVRLAAQRFGGNLDEIKLQTVETMSGALRGIVGKMTVREIIGDREAFAQEAISIAQDTLTNQGLALDTFQIRNIVDETDYLVNLGRPEAAEVEKRALIAEADAEQIAEQKSITVKTNIALANRELALKQADILAETDKKAAEAAAAKPLETAQQQQRILEEARKVEEQKALVEEKRLEATVKKKADADRYETEQAAEAKKTSSILAAQAEQESTIARAKAKAEQDALVGQGKVALAEADAKSQEAEARGRLALATAEAEGIRAKGLAEADATLAKGNAEAESMEKRAEAFKQYGEAAILETVIKVLPEIAKPFAEGYANVGNLSIIDSNGTAKLGQSIAENIAQVKEVVRVTTGFDLDGVTKGFSALNNSESGPLEGTTH